MFDLGFYIDTRECTIVYQNLIIRKYEYNHLDLALAEQYKTVKVKNGTNITASHGTE